MLVEMLARAIAKPIVKGIAKKTIMISGGAAVAVAAGGTTAGVLIHNYKNKKAAENEAPVEDAGAEKIDSADTVTSASDKATTTSGEENKVVVEEKSTVTAETAQSSEVASEKAEVEQHPNVVQPIYNPALQYKQMMGMQGNQFDPMYQNQMIQPPQMPMVPDTPVQEEVKQEVKTETQEQNTEVVAEIQPSGDDKITAADVATGNVANKQKKKGNKK